MCYPVWNKRIRYVRLTFSPHLFQKHLNSLITSCYSAAGRPHKVSNYQVFSAALYVLRTGVSWRDLPKCYGYWHTIYLRFKKGSDRGIWWSILVKWQRDKRLTMDVVMADSTTFKLNRHGGGLKEGAKAKGEVSSEWARNFTWQWRRTDTSLKGC